MAKKVLITGMSGLIGGLLKNHLTELGGYELTALNRSSVAGGGAGPTGRFFPLPPKPPLFFTTPPPPHPTKTPLPASSL